MCDNTGPKPQCCTLPLRVEVLRVALLSDSHQMGASCECTRQPRVTSLQGPGRWQVEGVGQGWHKGASQMQWVEHWQAIPCSAESLSLLQALDLQPHLELLGAPGEPGDSESSLSCQGEGLRVARC